MKITVWRISNNWVPTKANLYNRRLTPDAACYICGLEEEFCLHAYGLPTIWSPPQSNWVQVNFDGGFNFNLMDTSSGVVVRDEYGLLMGAACNRQKNSRSPEMAEMKQP